MSSLLLLKSMLFSSAFHKSSKTKIKKRHKTKKKRLTMCRTCDDERGVIPIFNNLIQPNIPEEIQNFSGVTIEHSDNLSKYICQNCLDLLNGCIMFREMCQKTNKKMIEMSIKKEFPTTDTQSDEHEIPNMMKKHGKNRHGIEGDSDGSFSLSTPPFSDDNTEPWRCKSCKKEFYDIELYWNHIAKCEIESFRAAPESLEKTKKKSYLCDICGKTTLSKANLSIHMATHDNVFPYKCDVCPYRGRTSDLLKVHKRTHLAEKPFKCSQCPKASTTKSNLEKHIRCVHRKTAKQFKCTYCDKAFHYQHDTNRHIREIHLRQAVAECDICFKKFNTRKILQGHKLKIHKVRGVRHGRLPLYLQHEIREGENDISSSDVNLIRIPNNEGNS